MSSNFGECTRCKNHAPIVEEGVCIDCLISGESSGASRSALEEGSNEQSFINMVNMISEKLGEHTNSVANKLNTRLNNIEKQNAYMYSALLDMYSASAIKQKTSEAHESQTISNSISLNIIWIIMAIAFTAGTIIYFM